MDALDTFNAPASTLSRFHDTSAKFQRYKILFRRRWWFLLLTAAIAICVQALRITGKATEFVAVGKVMVGAQTVNPDPSKQVIASQQNNEAYGTQIEILESGELRRRALERVRSMNPELREIDVEIRVTQTKGSSILNVAAVGEDGKYTRIFLGALLDEYVAFRKEMIEKSLGSAMNKVIEEVLSREKQVKEKSASLNDYLQKNDLVIFEGDRNRAAEYLRHLQDSLATYQTEVKTMDKLQMDDYLRTKAAATPAAPGAANDARGSAAAGDVPRADDAFGGFARSEQDYLKALNDLKLLQSQRLSMLKNYKEAHESVREIDEKITNQQALIEIYRQASLEDWARRNSGLKLKIASFEEQILEQTAKARDANNKIVQHLILKSEYERSNDDYKDWKKTLDRLDASHVITSDNVAIMERPVVAVETEPDLVLPLIMALGIGLAAGSVILLLFDRLDDRMNSFSEFQALFPNESILGQIPEQSGRGDVTLLRPSDDRHLYAEAFRNLRSSILFKNWKGGKPPKLILITSAVPNEGKTTTVANFAVTLALGGARVLLGDADLRRGGVNELFKANATPGFAEVLTAKLHWRDAVQETSTKGLHLLARGEALDQTSELFLSPLAQDVLREMADEYDYVVFDSAPVLVADDTASFAPMLDATLFVVRMSSTMARLSAKALDQLYDRQVNVVGVVLNRSNTNLKEYTYYNYASYYSISAQKAARDANAPAEA